jgi:modulator of FtsH protease
MTAYVTSEWSDFGVGVAGAAAALAGLLFVAVSINVERIVSYPTLPSRAVQTLITFVYPLLIGLWILVPAQPPVAVGVELLATALAVGGLLIYHNRPSQRSDQETQTSWLFVRLFPSLAILILTVVAGASVMSGAGGGLYWLPPVVVLAFIAGLANAWVLLLEILR